MRVLIVSWFFPPANTMGALRTGKFADYLIRQGHDIRVLTSELPSDSPTLPVPAGCTLSRTRNADVNAVPRWLARTLRRAPRAAGNAPLRLSAASADPAGPAKVGPKKRLGRLYEDIVNFPDKQVGWLPGAVRAGWRIAESFRPDVVFATAPPFTGALVGSIIAGHRRSPLVVEMRDRWSDDPYRAVHGLRARLEHRLERWVMGRSTGIVTVSEPWARTYADAHQKPAVAVANGFDPNDLARAAERRVAPASEHHLVIRHVGRIYPGRRDPSPLFAALARLAPDQRAAIRVEFIGTSSGIAELADRYGVRDNIATMPSVDHLDALKLQMDADIVLLLQWNDPAERGNVPGKLFEYLATRRPILGHGDVGGVPASIIRARNAGLYDNDPERIAAFLRENLDEKRRSGVVPPNSPDVSAGFDRDSAYAYLTEFLVKCAGNKAAHMGAAR